MGQYSPERPYLQNSQWQLKSCFSRDECIQLRESMKKHARTLSSKDEIKKELQECQQLYKELSMLNQFFGQPLDMPPPHYCFNQLTYRLAVVFSMSKDAWKDIESFCEKNEIFQTSIQEIYKFCISRVPEII